MRSLFRQMFILVSSVNIISMKPAQRVNFYENVNETLVAFSIDFFILSAFNSQKNVYLQAIWRRIRGIKF